MTASILWSIYSETVFSQQTQASFEWKIIIGLKTNHRQESYDHCANIGIAPVKIQQEAAKKQGQQPALDCQNPCITPRDLPWLAAFFDTAEEVEGRMSPMPQQKNSQKENCSKGIKGMQQERQTYSHGGQPDDYGFLFP